MRVTIAIAAVAAAASWWATSTHYKLQISKAAEAQTAAHLDKSTKAVEVLIERQSILAHTINKATLKAQENKDAQDKTNAILLGLRGDVAGLHSGTKELSARIATASREDIAEYATTCRAVFAAVVEAGERLSIGGARIAEKADGHAVDAGR